MRTEWCWYTNTRRQGGTFLGVRQRGGRRSSRLVTVDLLSSQMMTAPTTLFAADSASPSGARTLRHAARMLRSNLSRSNDSGGRRPERFGINCQSHYAPPVERVRRSSRVRRRHTCRNQQATTGIRRKSLLVSPSFTGYDGLCPTLAIRIRSEQYARAIRYLHHHMGEDANRLQIVRRSGQYRYNDWDGTPKYLFQAGTLVM